MLPLFLNQSRNFKDLGFDVVVQASAGSTAAFTDDDYTNAGASIASDNLTAIQGADLIVKVNPPTDEEVNALQKGQIWMSQLFHRLNEPLVKALQERGVSAFSLDAMPRISRAQSMDVLSSQSNLSGISRLLLELII